MCRKVTSDSVGVAFKMFRVKNLKGRPNIKDEEEYCEMVEMWVDSLSDIDAHVFIAACKSLSDKLTFYPAFAEVRTMCLDMQHGKKLTALEAWPTIKRMMTAAVYQSANPGDFDRALGSISDPVVREAAKAFDWKTFGVSAEKEESFHKTQFSKLFDSIAVRKGVEDENTRLGLPAPGTAEMLGMVVKQIK